MKRFRLFFVCFLFLFPIGGFAEDSNTKVLAVIAHSDDEVMFTATLYKIAHALNGTVDIAIITNGEGGYKYSSLAEPIYGLELTDEAIGRKHLPFIRKMETLKGGKIIGVNNYIFFEEKDHRYTQDVHEVFQGIWDIPKVKASLRKLLEQGRYDYVFTLIPSEETHGHHKAATILALQAVEEMRQDDPPIVLAAGTFRGADKPYAPLPGFPITQLVDGSPVAEFDKTKPFGYKGKLNYQIIVNWVIAEHKSQGTLQNLVNKSDKESFYFFSINPPEKAEKVKLLFEKLNQ